MKRRNFIQAPLALAATTGLSACSSLARAPDHARVVIIGGGYGGATAAKYIRLFSDYRIEVVLIEPEGQFLSCPMSNLIIGGSKTMADISSSYSSLSSRHGVQQVRDSATAIDAERKLVTLARGNRIRYDKLVLSPGVDLMFDSIEGLQAAHDSGQILQAWKAGPETQALRRQLEAMPDGGVFAITIPEAPYRCPPGPYERASQVASYFKRAKPRAKVLILDANPDVTSKSALFKKYWAEQYPTQLEYVPGHKLMAVDARSGSLKFEVQADIKADLLNVLPPMRAGARSTSRPSRRHRHRTSTSSATRPLQPPSCPNQAIWRMGMARLPLRRSWRSYRVWTSTRHRS